MLLVRLLLCAVVAGAAVVSAAELRIGVIGLDTFHAIQYLQAFNDEKSAGHVRGGRIVAGFVGGSPDVEMSRDRLQSVPRQAKEKFGLRLHDSIEELTAQVDAIIITSIDGRTHLPQFRRTLGAGKPVFIDKPFAGSLRDAIEIVRLARETGTPCFSASSLRFATNSPARQAAQLGEVRSAYAWGPADIEPHHPDLFWYGVHAVEALYTVLGPGCTQVVRTTTPSTDIVTGVWRGGRIGTVQGNRGHEKKMGVIAYGAKATITGGDKHSLAVVAARVMEFFQTRTPPVPLEETLEIFAFMEAADESKRRGGAPVTLAEVMALAGGK